MFEVIPPYVAFERSGTRKLPELNEAEAHGEIARRIKEQKPDEAAEAMRVHMDEFKEYILDNISGEPAEK